MPIDVDTLLEAIANRRSLGLSRLKEDPVPKEVLEKMLEAANWAPSNGDTEPWRFTVFTGDSRKALGDAFAEAYKLEETEDFKEITYESYRDRAMSSPVWISIGVSPELRPDGTLMMPIEEEMMATACAVQNLHLIASAAGLIGMWHSKGVSVAPNVAKLVGLEAPSRLLGFFWCGYPNVPWPAGERKPISEKVRWA